jgi:hypothetical protein
MNVAQRNEPLLSKAFALARMKPRVYQLLL